jgi:hypothetical protein
VNFSHIPKFRILGCDNGHQCVGRPMQMTWGRKILQFFSQECELHKDREYKGAKNPPPPRHVTRARK